MASLQPKAGPSTWNPASLLVLDDQAPFHKGTMNDSDTSSITEASAGLSDGDSDAYVAEPSDESTPMPKKRKMERWYLAGEARCLYRQTWTLDSTSLDGSVSLSSADEVETPAGTPISSATSKPLVCNSCSPVLDKYALTFKSILKQGSSRILILISQTSNTIGTWLNRMSGCTYNNIFDPLGNYLFCSPCVNAALGVSFNCLAHLRSIMKAQFLDPMKMIPKCAVEEVKLGKFFVIPSGCDLSFALWWKTLQSDAVVSVGYPHERHGLAGKPVTVCESRFSYIRGCQQPA